MSLAFSHLHLKALVLIKPTDLQKRLDQATYCFRTQVFEAIGAVLVGPSFFIDRRNKSKAC